MTSPVLPDPDRRWLDALDRDASQQALHERVEAAWRLCRDVHDSLPRPAVWLDLRGKGAGQAHFGRGGLRFNPVLFDDHRHAFLVEVVPHEMAHWLVHHLADGQHLAPHGHEWRTVMRQLFGLEPRVTHQFDTRRASPSPYRYRCACREHDFTARRHGLARKGRQYLCRDCRRPLIYVGRSDGA
ncbi:SprT-like domain-containing protein [Halomonas sp. 18H]|uniref:SprT family zinc-dependent metalloprotease n=1 Tax=Halomonas almeriensis TaxID=308163 RepID=UPI00223092BC|nr:MULTISPECIES: SprT-like domain-containing protein [Halomonas]MCW4149530.1 SprT-like domain-containing protein [Halomonas sp. 18H]MDN3553524.1 SprT-like domain-containing protein [Halomonas almeriensis]